MARPTLRAPNLSQSFNLRARSAETIGSTISNIGALAGKTLQQLPEIEAAKLKHDEFLSKKKSLEDLDSYILEVEGQEYINRIPQYPANKANVVAEATGDSVTQEPLLSEGPETARSPKLEPTVEQAPLSKEIGATRTDTLSQIDKKARSVADLTPEQKKNYDLNQKNLKAQLKLLPADMKLQYMGKRQQVDEMIRNHQSIMGTQAKTMPRPTVKDVLTPSYVANLKKDFEKFETQGMRKFFNDEADAYLKKPEVKQLIDGYMQGKFGQGGIEGSKEAFVQELRQSFNKALTRQQGLKVPIQEEDIDNGITENGVMLGLGKPEIRQLLNDKFTFTADEVLKGRQDQVKKAESAQAKKDAEKAKKEKTGNDQKDALIQTAKKQMIKADNEVDTISKEIAKLTGDPVKAKQAVELETTLNRKKDKARYHKLEYQFSVLDESKLDPTQSEKLANSIVTAQDEEDWKKISKNMKWMSAIDSYETETGEKILPSLPFVTGEEGEGFETIANINVPVQKPDLPSGVAGGVSAGVGNILDMTALDKTQQPKVLNELLSSGKDPFVQMDVGNNQIETGRLSELLEKAQRIAQGGQ